MIAARDFELAPHAGAIPAELVAAAEQGEVVYLTRDGEPVAAIVRADVAAAAVEALEDSEAQPTQSAADVPSPDAEWWTTSDVAAYLGVRVGTVSSYRTRGQMPEPDQTIGRTHMWRPDRIVQWHTSRTRAGIGGRPTLRATGQEHDSRVGKSSNEPEAKINATS